jgi:protein SCO1/2
MLKKLISLLFLIFVACGSESPEFNGSDISEANLDGRVELTSHEGLKFDSQDLLGNVIAVFFGFTNCPDICPTSLTELKLISSEIKNPEKFKIIFVSVDPGRDTIDILGDYIPRFGKNIYGLTGSKDEVKKVADQFKVFFQAVPQGESYTIDHSAGIYLVDKDGQVRIRYPFGTNIDLIKADIDKLI